MWFSIILYNSWSKTICIYLISYIKNGRSCVMFCILLEKTNRSKSSDFATCVLLYSSPNVNNSFIHYIFLFHIENRRTHYSENRIKILIYLSGFRSSEQFYFLCYMESCFILFTPIFKHFFKYKKISLTLLKAIVEEFFENLSLMEIFKW